MLLGTRVLFSGGKGGGTISVSKIRFIVYAVYAGEGGATHRQLLQLSEVHFIDANSSIYKLPSTAKVTTTKAGASANEGPDKLFDGKTSTKYCVADPVYLSDYPIIVTIDLGGETFDYNTYSRWRWYTAGDSAMYQNRSPKSFAIEFFDGSSWVVADRVDDFTPPKANYALAYEGELKP